MKNCHTKWEKFRLTLFSLSRTHLAEHSDTVLEALANAIRKEKEIRYKDGEEATQPPLFQGYD